MSNDLKQFYQFPELNKNVWKWKFPSYARALVSLPLEI